MEEGQCPLILVGYILSEKYSRRFFCDEAGVLDQARSQTLQGEVMTEAIIGVSGTADGRSVVETHLGRQMLITVSIRRVLVERPISTVVQKLTNQMCFSGYMVEADASLNDTGETVLTLRLLLDPLARDMLRDHNGLLFSVKDGDAKAISVTPLMKTEEILRFIGDEEMVSSEPFDRAKLN
jgi:hypothetical protein